MITPFKRHVVYILGPMRGVPLFNFPVFDRMASALTMCGHIVFNPADLDRVAGFNPDTLPEDWDWNVIPKSLDMQKIIDRDVEALRKCDAYVALPGWEKSTGARAEKGLLDWQGAVRLNPETFQPWEEGCGSPESLKAFDKSLKAFDKVAAGPLEDANPKDIVGQSKPALHLVPPALLIWVAKAMENGAKKYGPYNWRETKVRASAYVSAALRHLMAFQDGEEVAADSGIPHLAHAAACLGILMDAKECDRLIDDRPRKGCAADLIGKLTLKPS